jgi:hypothetical protein
MLLIGEVPQVGTAQDINLQPYDSTTAVKLSDAAYSNKAVLLSFIDINNGWSWLDSMKNIRTSPYFPGSAEMIAVIFKYGGSVQKTDVLTKIGAATYPFKILVDNAWGATSVAYTYMNGFKHVNDPEYGGLDDACAGNTTWSYLVQTDHRVTDKWHYNCWSDVAPSNNDPISFRYLAPHAAFLALSGAPGVGPIQLTLSNIVENPGSAALAGDRSVVWQGAPNTYTPSFAGPRMKSVIPAEGSAPTAVSPILVAFTNAVAGGAVAANYALGGSGRGSLAVASVQYVDSINFDTVNHTREDFDSKNFPNVEYFVRQRLIQICCDPAILYAEPEKDTTLCALMPIKVHFSKPMDPNTIIPGNFSTTPSSPSVTNAIYTGRDLIENMATLTLGGTLTTGPYSITAGPNVRGLGTVPIAGSSSIPYSIDITPPNAPTVSGPGCTNVRRPTWTWNAAPDAVIFRTSTDNGLTWTQTTQTSYTPSTDLADGNYTLLVQAADECGNWSASGSWTITIKTTLPAAPTMHCPSCTNVKRPTWTWDPVTGATKYRYSTTNGPTWTETTQTSYTPTSDLPDASYTLYVQAGDNCGNWSLSASCTLIVDTQAPPAPTMHCPSCTNVKRPTWTWDPVTGAARYRYSTDNGLTWTVTTQTNYTPSSDLADGNYTLYVQAGDACGNWSTSASCTLTVDTQAPPAPTMQCPSTTTSKRPTWSWNDVTGAVKYRYNLSSSPGWNETTQFSFVPTVDLADGTHTLSVQAGDACGNWSASASCTVTIQPCTGCLNSICGTCVNCVSCLNAICTPAICATCIQSICPPTICGPCLHLICPPTICGPCLHDVCPPSICAKCVNAVCPPAMCAKCINSVCTNILCLKCVGNVCTNFLCGACVNAVCTHGLCTVCQNAICTQALCTGCLASICAGSIGGCMGAIGCPAIDPIPVDTFSEVMRIVFDPARTGTLKERLASPEVQARAKAMPKGMWKALSMMITRIAKGKIRG